MTNAVPLPRAAVVFDCDGTLVATLGAWERSYETLFAAHDRAFDRNLLRGLVGLPLEALGNTLAELLHRPGDELFLSTRMVELLTRDAERPVRPTPGAVEIVRALHGTRPLAVASNTPRPIVEEYLHQVGLLDAFDAVVGCDDVPAPKPAPDMYLAACARMAVPPASAVAIEDCPTGIASARRAGLCVVALSTGDLPGVRHARALDDEDLWRDLGLPLAHPTARREPDPAS